MPPLIKISGYTSHKQRETGRMVPGCIPYETDFYTEMERIRDGYYKVLIEYLRSIEDPEEKKYFKAGFLPSLTISAICNRWRSLENIVSHTGLLNIDIDTKGNEHVNDWAATRDDLFEKGTGIICAFLSASGNGVTFVVRVKPDLHLDTFLSLADDIYDRFKLRIDLIAKDASRLRFVSYDPDTRIRYNIDELEIVMPTKHYWQKQKEQRERTLSVLPAGDADSINNFREAIIRAESGISPHYFYEGEKHKYLIAVAGYCNSTGMSESYCERMVFKFFRHLTSIKDEELRQPIKNVYHKYKNQFGVTYLPKKKYIPLKLKRFFLTYISKDLLKKYIFIYNACYIKGESTYTIKVDSSSLVFFMWLIAPEYTWTCLNQGHDKYFTREECRDLIPENSILDTVNGSRVWVNKQLQFPANW